MKPEGMRLFDSVTRFTKRVVYDLPYELIHHLCSSMMNLRRTKSECLWGLVLRGML